MKLKNKKLTRILFAAFYFILNILLMFALIISVGCENLFPDTDTALYWIGEIMFAVRQIAFIALGTVVFTFYIEKGESCKNK